MVYFIYGELDETSLYVMRRHYDLKNIYGESPVVVEACRQYFIKQLNVIEDHLKSQETILKNGFGLADFLMTCLDWAIFYEFSLLKIFHHIEIKYPKELHIKRQ